MTYGTRAKFVIADPSGEVHIGYLDALEVRYTSQAGHYGEPEIGVLVDPSPGSHPIAWIGELRVEISATGPGKDYRTTDLIDAMDFLSQAQAESKPEPEPEPEPATNEVPPDEWDQLEINE